MQQSDDPYLVPAAALTPAVSTKRHYGLASPMQRFGNMIIDNIGCGILVAVVGGVWGGVDPEAATQMMGDTFVGYAFSMSVATLYYMLLEGFTGRTLGKLVTGTKVIGVEGGKPGLLRALGRSLARYIPLEQFTFFTAGKPGLHDSLSKTVVVRLKPSDLQRQMDGV